MERVQEALDNDDFLWFLNEKRHYTNGPTYFEQLKYWLEQAKTGPLHHKIDFNNRAIKLFNTFLIQFSQLSPSRLPSYHFSFAPLFPKKECLLGWTYKETVQCKYLDLPNKEQQQNQELDALLLSVTQSPFQDCHTITYFWTCDIYVTDSDKTYNDFNSTHAAHQSVAPYLRNGTKLTFTFKFLHNLDLQLIHIALYAPRKKK
jgi:hypothetical protein